MTFARSIALLSCALLLLPGTVFGQQPPPDGHTIEGLSHPESVAFAPDGAAAYAANIGDTLAPLAKDGDGFIARLSPDGTIETRRFVPAPGSEATLHAPKGTVVLNGHLYTADVDRVVGFDRATRAQTADIDLRKHGVSFLNDLTVIDGQTLVASATKQGRLYRVDLAAGTATALDVRIPGVNGVAYVADEKRLYAVTFGGDASGALWTLTMDAAGRVQTTSTRRIRAGDRFDGIVHRDGTVFISAWGVKGTSGPALYRVAEAGRGAVTRVPLSGWGGAADFDCADGRGCWIPDLPGNAVTVVRPESRK